MLYITAILIFFFIIDRHGAVWTIDILSPGITGGQHDRFVTVLSHFCTSVILPRVNFWCWLCWSVYWERKNNVCGLKTVCRITVKTLLGKHESGKKNKAIKSWWCFLLHFSSLSPIFAFILQRSEMRIELVNNCRSKSPGKEKSSCVCTNTEEDVNAFSKFAS